MIRKKVRVCQIATEKINGGIFEFLSFQTCKNVSVVKKRFRNNEKMKSSYNEVEEFDGSHYAAC